MSLPDLATGYEVSAEQVAAFRNRPLGQAGPVAGYCNLEFDLRSGRRGRRSLASTASDGMAISGPSSRVV